MDRVESVRIETLRLAQHVGRDRFGQQGRERQAPRAAAGADAEVDSGGFGVQAEAAARSETAARFQSFMGRLV